MAKQKVAILGGGCGAVAAAFELTATPELRARYDVTIYTNSYRLGGKGASGRNAQIGQRIEEHGLHMWMGFYANAFRVMRACFLEWQKPPGMSPDFPAALFEPQDQVTMQQYEGPPGSGHWQSWSFKPKVQPGNPWDTDIPNLQEMLSEIASWLHAQHAQLEATPDQVERHGLLERIVASAEHIAKNPLIRSVELHVLYGLLTAFHDMLHLLHRCTDEAWEEIMLMLDVITATMRGLVLDVMINGNDNVDVINNLDYRAWLIKHGACPANLATGLVKGLYDLGFAYVRGDSSNPASAQAAAGVALRVLLLMCIGSRGAPLWKMKAGMGDTIFAPFYDVLKARGVRFEFFHRVESFGITSSGTDHFIDSINITRKVRILNDAPYDPKLFDLKGFRCWPAEPDWSQIENGTAIQQQLATQHLNIESYWCNLDLGGTRTLQRGVDFDQVVCAISLGELTHIAANFPQYDARWGNVFAQVLTVPTQSIQLWLTPQLPQLGWALGPTVSVGYTEPFDSWGEMSHLIPVEDWPPENGPQSIEYFCGALLDTVPLPPRTQTDFPYQQQLVVAQNAITWIEQWIAHLWPRTAATSSAVASEPGFRWDLLFVPPGSNKSGSGRMTEQFIRVNVDPSERYVLSVPNSPQYRLPPNDSGFQNMAIAGDWTRSLLNSGCVEAAMESGVGAAEAILARTTLAFLAS